MKDRFPLRGMTVFEIMFTTTLIGVVALIAYALVNIGTILGAKNTSINVAHQQARTAMLQMTSDLHSMISLPSLIDQDSNPVAGSGPAAGIAFQLWSIGPLQVAADANAGQNVVQVTLPNNTQTPVVGQHLVIPTHQVEADISAVSSPSGGKVNLTLATSLPVAISGTQSPTLYNIVCFITDRCSYRISGGSLLWTGPTVRAAFSVLGSDITSATPFSIPTTPAGALYYRFVTAVDLSTADPNYSNRGFKSANIMLNGQVPMRARLTTYQ